MLYSMNVKKTLLFLILFLVPTVSYAQTVTLQDKIDQLFIVGFRGTTYKNAPELQTLLRDTNLGGVILFDYDSLKKRFGRNITTSAQVRALTKEMQKHAQTPLLVSIDEEGGRVSRLKKIPGYRLGASAKVLGTRPVATVEATATRLGTYIKSLGITTNFAPVLDIDTGKQNPIIGKYGRAFGTTPEKVGLYGGVFAKGLEKGGVRAVGKHFPGHGSALSDSHKEFTDITSVWTDAELIPFQKACEAGIGAIMVGHLVDRRVDPVYPATLSKAHIDRLESIGCTTQLVVSDDMDMKAISAHYSQEEAAIQALGAGVDMLIYSNNIDTYTPLSFLTIRKAIYDAVQSGRLSESAIDAKYQKVLLFKGIK